jgi:hypothetical protein
MSAVHGPKIPTIYKLLTHGFNRTTRNKANMFLDWSETSIGQPKLLTHGFNRTTRNKANMFLDWSETSIGLLLQITPSVHYYKMF